MKVQFMHWIICFFFPHQNVFDGREALGHDLSATDFSDSREEELIRLLCKKDVSAIDSWFQDFSRWLTENFRTKSFTFIQIYSLLGRILKFFYELNLDTHDLEAKILYVYNHLGRISYHRRTMWLAQRTLPPSLPETGFFSE